jgi:hypothetical protein
MLSGSARGVTSIGAILRNKDKAPLSFRVETQGIIESVTKEPSGPCPPIHKGYGPTRSVSWESPMTQSNDPTPQSNHHANSVEARSLLENSDSETGSTDAAHPATDPLSPRRDQGQIISCKLDAEYMDEDIEP